MARMMTWDLQPREGGAVELVYWDTEHGADIFFQIDPDGTAYRTGYDEQDNETREPVNLGLELVKLGSKP